MPKEEKLVNKSQQILTRDFATGRQLDLVARRIRQHQGIDLVPYARHLFIDTKLVDDRYFVKLRPRETALDPFFCIPKEMSVPSDLTGADAQLYALVVCYLRSKAHLVTSADRWYGLTTPTAFHDLAKINYIFKPLNDDSRRPEELFFKLRAKLIESPRLIPYVVLPSKPRSVIRKEYKLFPPPTTPPYIHDIYKEYTRYFKDTRPLEEFTKTNILGGSYDGIINALGELARSEMKPNVDAATLITSIIAVWKMHGLSEMFKLRPQFAPGCFRGLSTTGQKSGGLYPTQESSTLIGNVNLKMTGNLDKESQEWIQAELLDEINAKLFQRYDQGIRDFDVNIYPPHLNIPEIKTQVRKDTKDRIFFNSPTWYYLLQKYIFQYIVDFNKRTGMSGIGLQWFDGDAQKIFNSFKGFKKFLEADLSKQDQTLLGHITVTLLGSTLLFFDPSEPRTYWVLRHHLKYICHASTVRILQWPDGTWRIVLFMNFSGEYITAFLNTLYSMAVFVYYLVDLAVTQANAEGKRIDIKKAIFDSINLLIRAAHSKNIEEAISLIEKSCVNGNFAGDDSVAGAAEPVSEVFSLKGYREVAEKKFKLQMPNKNCNETITMLSRMNLDGTIVMRDWKPEDEDTIYQKSEGLVFLKHYFVARKYYSYKTHEDELVVVPTRDIRDHWHRAGSSISPLNDKYMEIARLHGLMFGSMGTNPALYNFHYNFKEILLHQEADRLKPLSDYNERAQKIADNVYLDDTEKEYMYRSLNTDFVEQIKGAMQETLISYDLTKNADISDMRRQALMKGNAFEKEFDFRSCPTFSEMTKKMFDATLYNKDHNLMYFRHTTRKRWPKDGIY